MPLWSGPQNDREFAPQNRAQFRKKGSFRQAKAMVITMNPNICNQCGGDYEYRGGRWVCRACGSYKPESITNEEVTLLYTAHQKLRLAEFAEAELEFDDFIRRYPENPCGYWGRLLARYGIQYERDFDGRMIPTCYAASIGSVRSASDYKKALQYADAENRAYYESQAEYMERMRGEWQEKAKKEKPYDIFICYKDSDVANGIERTKDSYAAQELYTLLTDMGFRVFYSRVSLRDKVGEKYEPYIFHALSTAQVMIVYGSDPAYIQSTWMKNEWMRYAKQIREGKKKPESLLVACEGFSPEELPGALASMQCFRAEDKTFYGDLQNRVSRLLGCEETEVGGREGTRRKVRRKGRRRRGVIPLIVTLAFAAVLLISYLRSQGPAELEFVSNGDGTCYISDIRLNGDTHIDIPAEYEGDRVTGIGESAFSFSSGLTSVTVPAGVTRIEDHAFSYCDDLQSVTLQHDVESIGDYAFADCVSLTSIELPATVTEIGEYAFYGCDGLTELMIPEGVTDIGNSAFSSCENLTSVVIVGPLSSVGYGVFSTCLRLNTVTFAGDRAVMGDSMFEGCTHLSDVTVLSLLDFVGANAFSGCVALEVVRLPERVGSMDYGAFENCPSLTHIYYGGTTAQWEQIHFRSDWDYNTGAYTVYCTDGTVDKTDP